MSMNKQQHRVYLVAAMASNRVIGNGPDIPWRIPGEQKIFKQLTEGKVVAMGRKTFESIGKPLPKRHIVVISRDPGYQAPGCSVVASLEQAMQIAIEQGSDLYVAGGAQIYALALPYADGVHLSEIQQAFAGDAFFPALDPQQFQRISCESIEASIPYTYSVFQRLGAEPLIHPKGETV